jgi:hypothetical protein
VIQRDDTDEDVSRAISRYESIALYGGLTVVFGLLTEVALAAAFHAGKSILENWGPVIADALVALGVAAEIAFARMSAGAREELQRRSEERVAFANERGAAANERAAKLELEIQRMKTPRQLYTGHVPQLMTRLSPFAGTEYDIGLQQGDPEASDLSGGIEFILKEAGWQQVGWRGMSIVAKRQGNPHDLGIVSLIGVQIQMHLQARRKIEPAALSLRDALLAVGISAAVSDRISVQNENVTAVHVLVGQKPLT